MRTAATDFPQASEEVSRLLSIWWESGAGAACCQEGGSQLSSLPYVPSLPSHNWCPCPATHPQSH
jgi:hypothetical protein